MKLMIIIIKERRNEKKLNRHFLEKESTYRPKDYQKVVSLIGTDDVRGSENFVTYIEDTGEWTRFNHQAFFSSY